MARREILDRIQKYVHPFRITKGKDFRLKHFDPRDTCGLQLDKGEAAELLTRGTEWLAEEQEMLYAQDRWSLLLVFQAMDAAGKDGTIKHVMSGVNPQGCQVSSFKQPSSEDLDHDFLWRYVRHLPERGRIGISSIVLTTRKSSSYACTPKSSRSRSCLQTASASGSGISALPTSLTSRTTSPDKARSFSSSSCTYRARSRRSASWSVSTVRRSTGSSPPPISKNDVHRTTICTRSRRRSGPPRRNTRRGTSSLQTTSGSLGSSSPPLSCRQWRDSISASPKSMWQRRKSS